MTPRLASRLLLFLLALVFASPLLADSSHVRIVRLSYVQGDVRYLASFHNDSLADPSAAWQTAPLNLPLREGFALSTGANSRAEIEFENGALGFLDHDTVIEFYDLTLHDGSRVSRLVLRQGSSSFYVNAQGGDYFSVTGGDFTVEATGRSTFRLDNFDNGSTVQVEAGDVSVIRNDKSTPLMKGQSLSVDASNPAGQILGSADFTGSFDRWVNGQTQSAVVSSSSPLNPSGGQAPFSSYGFAGGFMDLSTFGYWQSVSGYGPCWQPFGVGLGWNPFAASFGNWYLDPFFGWTFIGAAPWGWAPYHYGAWIMVPGRGWAWTPGSYNPGNPYTYRPSTAVWVQSGGALGIVPLSPKDSRGKTPLNISHGVYPVEGGSVGRSLMIPANEKWSVLKSAPATAFGNSSVASAAPSRIYRTLPAGQSGSRNSAYSPAASVAFDPATNRFVNSYTGSARPLPAPHGNLATVNETLPARASAPRTPGAPASPAAPSTPRVAPAPRPVVTPAPARPSGSSGGSHPSASGGSWGSSGVPRSSIPSSSPAPAPRPSSGSSGSPRPH